MSDNRNCYTYLIGWTEHKKFYYGRRTRVGCNPSELWVKYFTSSIHVKRFAKTNGPPDVIQVRKTFGNNYKKCELWEAKVLRRMNVESHDLFLNRRNSQEPFTTSGVAPSYDNEGKYFGLISISDERWGKSLFGANKFQDTSYLEEINKQNVRNKTHNFLGDKNPSRKRARDGTHHFLKNSYIRNYLDEVQRSLVKNNLHHWQSEEHKKQTGERTRLAIENGEHPTAIMLSCIACKKTGQKAVMQRWHLENCKSLKTN
jgi:hypothetical protein